MVEYGDEHVDARVAQRALDNYWEKFSNENSITNTTS